MNYLEELFNLRDTKYLDFNKSIVNNSVQEIIGVRLPLVKDIAKRMSKDDYISYLEKNDFKYYEEILIYGFLIGYSKDIGIYDKYLDKFSYLINDWSVCDSCVSLFKLIGKNREYFITYIEELLCSKDEFRIRLGIIILMKYYLVDDYIDYVIDKLLVIKSNKYYVNMAIAWTVCEIYIKYKNKMDKYIYRKYFNDFVFSKSISKICDSYRVSDYDKERLKKKKELVLFTNSFYYW